MAMGHKRGQPGETPTNSQKPPPGFNSPGRVGPAARCPRWAQPSGAEGIGTPGQAEVTAAPPYLIPKSSPGMRPVLPEGCQAEEKSPPCFDQRSPATSITVVWDGMKQPEQRGAPRPGWAEPWGAHPPHSTENQRMESPVGHRGSRRARRRLLPAPVCSSKVMHGCRERAGLVASLHGKVSACGARQGKLALVPQGCSRPPHLSWMGLGMRWQEVTLQIHLRMPALEGRCHTAFP
ncbi:uncharacterized protein LOC128849244 isoform X3 [Cuculus canorus]|uniref:uncharacterized protein LOC128849244 isoform X3 n=1 Tax=Cuculus canorus TaxID=55661 RepID=UPI0023AB5032|nr:uncharacterized protein LOC128849244 isoform X3 [Cuculus canorus]